MENLPVTVVQGTKLSVEGLIGNPDLMDTIFAHVANGGSLIELCQDMWKVRYDRIVKWIYADAGRRKTYEDALDAGSEWFRNRVMLELRDLGTVDIRQAYNADGTLKAIHDMPPAVARAISSIEVDEIFQSTGRGQEKELVGYTRKVKLWDKKGTLELIGKRFGMFIERRQDLPADAKLEDIIAGSWTAPQPPPETPNAQQETPQA